MKISALVLSFAALIAAIPAGLAGADSPTTAGPTVQLPDFDVRDLPLVPEPERWRYAALPGIEVLSEVGDRATSDLLTQFIVRKGDLDFAARAIGRILGDAVALPDGELPAAPPLLVLLVKDASRLDDFCPGYSRRTPAATAGVTLHFRRAETSVIVFDAGDRVLNLPSLARESLQNLSRAIADSRPSNARDLDETTISEYIRNTHAEVSKSVDAPRALAREYVRLLWSRSAVPFPPWFEEGIAQLLAPVARDQNAIILGRLDSPDLGVPLLSYQEWHLKVHEAWRLMTERNNVAADALQALFLTAEDPECTFNRELRFRTLLPLEQLFAPPSDAGSRYPIGSVWAKQCEAFVHYCLFGEKEVHRAGLARWIAALQRSEPPTADLFEKSFGLNWDAFGHKLREYTADGPVFRPVRLRLKEGSASAATVTLRAATDAETGRMKSLALLAAGQTQAARAFAAATYIRGARTTDFLATLGIVESAAGNSERALRLLTALEPQLTAHPRALIELSRLRVASARARHAAALSDDDTVAALTPLLKAHSQSPALADVYVQIARVWEASSFRPDARHLELLANAVQQFPDQGELIIRTTRLFLGVKQVAAADVLVDFGQRQHLSEADKQFLRKLKADAHR